MARSRVSPGNWNRTKAPATAGSGASETCSRTGAPGVGDGEAVAGVAAVGDTEMVGEADDAAGAQAITVTPTNANTTSRLWVTDLDLPIPPAARV